jgi:hypothetical protein
MIRILFGAETHGDTEKRGALATSRRSAKPRANRFSTGAFGKDIRNQVVRSWTKNISAIGFLISAFLSLYLCFSSYQKDAWIVILAKHIELREKRISDLINEVQQYKLQIQAATEKVITRDIPTQFGLYAAIGNSPFQALDVLATERRDLPLDFPKYTDQPRVFFQQGVPIHLVLYDPIFSLKPQSKLAIHVVAKVKGEEAWVIRNRVLETQVFPQENNGDILDAYVAFRPGRYAIELNGKFYSFNIEGINDDPDFCVERKKGVFQNDYVVCRKNHNKS